MHINALNSLSERLTAESLLQRGVNRWECCNGYCSYAQRRKCTSIFWDTINDTHRQDPVCSNGHVYTPIKRLMYVDVIQLLDYEK